MSKAFIINVILAFNIYNALCIDVDSDQKILSRRKRFVLFPTGSSFSVAACMTVGVFGNPQFSILSWGVNYGFAYNLPTNSTYYLHPPQDIINFPFIDDSIDSTTTTITTTEETLPPEHDDSEHEQYLKDHPDQNRRKYQQINYNQNILPLSSSPYQQEVYPIYYPPKIETKPMMQRRYRRELFKNIESVIDRMGYHGRDCILRALCESPQFFESIGKRSMVEELIKTIFSFPKSKVLSFEPSHLVLNEYDEAHRKGRSRRNIVDCGVKYSRCSFSLIQLALGKYSHFNFMM